MSLPWSALRRKEPPLATLRHHANPSIVEFDSRTCHQIFHRARHKHLTVTRFIRDAHADLCRRARDSAIKDLTFARVQSGARLNTQPLRVFNNRERAANRARRTVEERERPIADHIDLASAKPLDLLRDVRPQAAQQLFPVTL